MRRSINLLTLMTALFVVACSEANKPPAKSASNPSTATQAASATQSVTVPASLPVKPANNEFAGKWVGSMFDLELAQSGAEITGKLCSERDQCLGLSDGKVATGKAIGSLFRMDDANKKTIATIELALAEDGKRLLGKVVDLAKKSSCDPKAAQCDYELLQSFSKDDGSECKALLGMAGTVVSGASGNAAISNGDATGKWLEASTRTGLNVLNLTQSGVTVAGTICEKEGHNCFDIDVGSVAANLFTGCFSFRERGARQTVLLQLSFSTDGKKLEGKALSTKGGTVPLSFSKQ